MDFEIDFLPERLKTQRLRRRRILRQAGLLSLAAAGVVVWACFSDGRVATAQARLDMLRDRCGNAQKLLAQRADLQRQQAELLIKERISQRLGSRADALEVMSELERLLPPQVSLINLSLDAVQVSVPVVAPVVRGGPVRAEGLPRESTVRRLRLVITGIAPSDVDVANFIAQLPTSPLFEDVNMGYVRSLVLQNCRAREFQVSCHVVR